MSGIRRSSAWRRPLPWGEFSQGWDRAFPLTMAWAESALPPTKVADLREQRDAVEYHLWAASDALAQAEAIFQIRRLDEQPLPTEIDWWPVGREQAVEVLSVPSLDRFLRYGDAAITSALSVIDTSLLFVNEATGRPRPREHLGWKGRNPLRPALHKLPGAGELVAAMDIVFGDDSQAKNPTERDARRAKGYNVLAGYRNWVIHRGAPVADASALWDPIPVPNEAFAGLDPEEARRAWFELRHPATEAAAGLQFRIDRIVEDEARQRVRIRCKAFVPPVAAVIDETFAQAPPGGIDLGQVYIAEGATNTRVYMPLRAGSLLDPQGQYDAANRVHFEESGSATRILDEELVTYTARNYLAGIRVIVYFAEEVAAFWDRELAAWARTSMP